MVQTRRGRATRRLPDVLAAHGETIEAHAPPVRRRDAGRDVHDQYETRGAAPAAPQPFGTRSPRFPLTLVARGWLITTESQAGCETSTGGGTGVRARGRAGGRGPGTRSRAWNGRWGSRPCSCRGGRPPTPPGARLRRNGTGPALRVGRAEPGADCITLRWLEQPQFARCEPAECARTVPDPVLVRDERHPLPR